MDQLIALKVFTNVAETLSFSRAAERLNLSRAAVSKHIHDLEAHVGARLLNRTTRRVALTDGGAAYYERARRILEDIADADRQIASLHTEPRGALRVLAPINFGAARLGPAIVAFLQRYPDVSVELVLSDRYIDPIEGGYDIVVRIGRPEAKSLIARKLDRSERILCASVEYLAKHGHPRDPDALTRHSCLSYSYTEHPELWRLTGPDGEITVRVSGRLITASRESLGAAMRAGLGIAHGPRYFFNAELETGKAEIVLPGYKPPAAEIFAIHASERHLSTKLKSFMDFMVRYFRTRPLTGA